MRSASRTGFALAVTPRNKILDQRRRILSFAPGSIFAFVRWTSNDFGTVISRIDILRAVAPGQRCATVPYVRPGGDILLRLSGWPKVERVLQIVDAIEALGIDPADAAPTIGITSTIACPSTKCRGPTRVRAIRPGCIGGGSRDDGPGGDPSNRRWRAAALVACTIAAEPATALHMECFGKRADRTLSVAANRPTLCH